MSSPSSSDRLFGEKESGIPSLFWTYSGHECQFPITIIALVDFEGQTGLEIRDDEHTDDNVRYCGRLF